MNKKGCRLCNFSNPSRILPVPELTVVKSGLGMQIKFWNMTRCLSKFWRLYWNDTPGAVLEFPDRAIIMSPGTMVLIPPYTLSSAHTIMPFTHNFVEFSPPITFDGIKPEPLIFDAGVFAPKIPIRSTIEWKNLALYVLVGKILLSIPPEKYDSGDDFDLDERIKRVLEYIDKNPMKRYSVNELCRCANLSPTRFMHLFKQETGHSPYLYWIHKRINQVGRLLAETDLSISEIATQAGFVDRSHLSRVFKKHTGSTIAAVRKLYIVNKKD